jgi:hypothetical protein
MCPVMYQDTYIRGQLVKAGAEPNCHVHSSTAALWLCSHYLHQLICINVMLFAHSVSLSEVAFIFTVASCCNLLYFWGNELQPSIGTPVLLHQNILLNLPVS